MYKHVFFKKCHLVESKEMVQINLFAKRKQSHRCREQTYGCQGGKWRGGMNWDTDIYKLLCNIKEITNKNLLYSTGNSTLCNDL